MYIVVNVIKHLSITPVYVRSINWRNVTLRAIVLAPPPLQLHFPDQFMLRMEKNHVKWKKDRNGSTIVKCRNLNVVFVLKSPNKG